MYRVDRSLNDDTGFFGFQFRTRYRYHDEKIIKEILGGEDYYRLPENPKVVVDIGANIGAFSILAAWAGAEVWAFEPEAYNYEVLCYNVEVNGFKDRIHCLNLAVGEPGETRLFVHPHNSGATSAYPDLIEGLDPGSFQVVKSISIHEVFRDHCPGHCDLLKLDCEGAEHRIVKDLDDSLVSRIGQVSIEIHGPRGRIRAKLAKWFNEEKTDPKRHRVFAMRKRI
jgi:FkbM family methyltransferase